MALQWYDIESQEAQTLLNYGHVESNKQRWVAHEVDHHRVGFATVEETAPSALGRWFTAIRAISLTATFMPGLATILWLWLSGFAINWPVAVSALIAVMCLQMAVNMFNDVEDYLKLIDLPGSLGGSGVIQQGWMSASQMNRGAWVCLILGCLLGLPALLNAPVMVLACGVAAVVGVVGYSGHPLRLKYRAFGDGAVLLLCGPVLTYGMTAAAIGQPAEGVIWIGLFFGFAATAILNANNINDMYTDSARGSITLAGKLGYVLARHWQTAYYLCAAGSLLALQMYPQGHRVLLLPLLALPVIVLHLRGLYLSPSPDDESLVEVRFEAAKTHLLLGLLLCVALVIRHFL